MLAPKLGFAHYFGDVEVQTDLYMNGMRISWPSWQHAPALPFRGVALSGTQFGPPLAATPQEKKPTKIK